MKSAAEDLARRRPVWEALSAVFLDTEIDDASRNRIAGTLRASGYSDAELEHILWRELSPVLHRNLLNVAGTWSGFDMEEVERQILAKPAGRLRAWVSYVVGGRLTNSEWKQIKDVLANRSRTGPTIDPHCPGTFDGDMK